ncbi:MAG: hypothetical protein EBY83_03100 [Verrucomicrobia bacterium]|nr:hypothetical protein [Verrucomicrobiota bacterium]
MDQNLETISQSGKAPKSRLKDAKAAYGIYRHLLDADLLASSQRVRVQSMLDGEAPYNSETLRNLGQSYRSNLNFLEAQADLEYALSAYSDLVNGVPQLAMIKTSFGDDTQRGVYSQIISEEFDRVLRKDWDEFFYNQQRLSHEFVAYGVGFAFFEDDTDWRWKVAGLKDFFVPRGVAASDTRFEFCCARRSYYAHELYQYIKDPKVAREVGWDVDETRRAIIEAVPVDTAGVRLDWEEIQVMLKDNDLSLSYARSAEIQTVHYYIQEFDGTITHAIGLRNGSNLNFLYRKDSRFSTINEALVLFTYGIGTNGTLHSIRGLGYKVYPHIQVTNRLRNAIIDSTLLSTSLMIQPQTMDDLANLTVAYNGPMAIIPPNLNIVDRTQPNLAGNALPIAQELTTVRRNNTGSYAPQSVDSGSGERTATEVNAQLEKEAVLSTQAQNFYYVPWGKLLREQFRRLARLNWKQDEPGAKIALLFHKRLKDRGVPLKALEKVYDITPQKAVGYGSAQARLLAFNEFMQMLPLLDETGRANVIRDRVAVRVGYDQVDRYAPSKLVAPRLPIDSKIAELENDSMQSGRSVTVQPNENHAVHLQVHGMDAMRFLQAIDQNAVPEVEAFKYLSLQTPHMSQHMQAIQGDKTREVELGQYKALLNKMNQAVQSLGNKIAKAQRDQQQAMAKAQQQQFEQSIKMQIDDVQAKAQADYAAKLAKVQADAAIQQESSRTRLRLKEEEAKQRMALRDAQTAQKLRAMAEKKKLAK